LIFGMISRRQIFAVWPGRRRKRIRPDGYWRWLRSTTGWIGDGGSDWRHGSPDAADWVHRFNEHGPIGLINIKPAGRRPKLSVEQQEALRQLVEAGPDPEKHGVVRWRCVDLQRVLGAQFGVDLSTVAIGRQLKRLGFSHISARPLHPAQDAPHYGF
jgi:transposase